MEETLVAKRPREEPQVEKDLDFEEYSKRHKPYNHIISLLDSDEEDSTEDLSPLMKTLQHEITSPFDNPDALLMGPAEEKAQERLTSLEDSLTSPHVLKEEDEKDKVMRHLLEASDDELGIPNSGDDAGWLGFGEELGLINSSTGDEFSSLCDKLWEIEDERANYYALLQFEILLWGQ